MAVIKEKVSRFMMESLTSDHNMNGQITNKVNLAGFKFLERSRKIAKRIQDVGAMVLVLDNSFGSSRARNLRRNGSGGLFSRSGRCAGNGHDFRFVALVHSNDRYQCCTTSLRSLADSVGIIRARMKTQLVARNGIANCLLAVMKRTFEARIPDKPPKPIRRYLYVSDFVQPLTFENPVCWD